MNMGDMIHIFENPLNCLRTLTDLKIVPEASFDSLPQAYKQDGEARCPIKQPVPLSVQKQSHIASATTPGSNHILPKKLPK